MANYTKQNNTPPISSDSSADRNTMSNASYIARSMRDFGLTPYYYVRQAFRQLVDGNYKEALRLIGHAATFEGIYYSEGSAENADFRESINLLRYIVLHLAEEFGLIGTAEGTKGEVNNGGDTDE